MIVLPQVGKEVTVSDSVSEPHVLHLTPSHGPFPSSPSSDPSLSSVGREVRTISEPVVSSPEAQLLTGNPHRNTWTERVSGVTSHPTGFYDTDDYYSERRRLRLRLPRLSPFCRCLSSGRNFPLDPPRRGTDVDIPSENVSYLLVNVSH